MSHLALFPMPNVDDITEHLLAQDVVWCSAAAWRVCWHVGGTTDSFGPSFDP